MSEEQKPQEKTQEQLSQERLERYQKAPESFVELSSIVCMIIRNPKSGLGISGFVNPATSRTQLDIAQAELNHLINKIRMQMDVASEMKKQSNIVKPGAMHRFASRIMGKK